MERKIKKLKVSFKKAAVLLTVFSLTSLAFAQEADDGFIVPLDEDFSKVPVQAAPAETGAAKKSSLAQGVWIEVTSQNESLIRNISDGTKSGYEFDNSHLKSKANWWFWGDIGSYFHLDTEIGVWNFDKTLYKANSYGANVPDVSWGDGLQSLLTMPASFLKEFNDNNIGAFNKMGFNIKTPWIEARAGYGDLKANGMSTFKGIYTILDRWNNVGDGYTEIRNGSAWREFGSFKLDVLAAMSEMRDAYGTYDIVDLKYGDVFEGAVTFGSTSSEEQLFYYNRTNENAFSAYAAVNPVSQLKIEGHYLGTFGTSTQLGLDSSAAAARIGWKGETWEADLMQSFAGEKADSVWGSDGQNYDDINADTANTQLNASKNFGKFSIGIDQNIKFHDTDNLSQGLMELRSQPYGDIDLSALTGLDMNLGIYGVFSFDRLARSTSANREAVFSFDEAALEFTASDVSPYLKKLTFDYGVSVSYNDWESGNSYQVKKIYHSFMANAQLTDRLNVHAGAIIRSASSDATNVPFAFTAGVKMNSLPVFGKPHIWAHFTYGMNPYEDNNYTLYRADDPLNKPVHRTYLLNSLDKNTTISQISLGLIWNL